MRQCTRLLNASQRLSGLSQLRQSSDWSYKPVSFIDPTPSLHDSDWILRRYLNRHPEDILEYLDLEPNLSLSTYNKIRVGRKGSLSVGLEDSLSGQWFNFETGQHGDMLDLIRQHKNLTEKEAVSLAKTLIDDKYFDKPSEPKTALKAEKLRPNIEAFVARIISECLPIAGSVAEEYLKETRGLTDLPDLNDIKYHPRLPTRTSEGSQLKSPGLVSIASHPQSKHSNIQVTFLDPKTKDKRKDVLVVKRSFGAFKCEDYYNACTISKSSESEVTFVSEGIENGLSLYQVRPEAHIVATLGKSHILNLDPVILARKVVLIWDNDGIDLESDVILLKIARRLQNAGKKLYLLMPAAIPGRSSTDLNDVLRSYGRQGVYDALQNTKKIEIN